MKLPIDAIEIQKITNKNYKTYYEETEAIQSYIDKQEKAFSLNVVSHQREQLETVIKELDLQVGTNYSADENLINTLMSSF